MPNVGKSTLFNHLTWNYSHVGNVDRITNNFVAGTMRNNMHIKIIDLPGIYSLNPTSDDEKITINNLFALKNQKIINVISVTNIKRDLLLTVELLELCKVEQIVINMIDVGPFKVNEFKLIQKLKTPINLISCNKNIGLKQTIRDLILSYKTDQLTAFNIVYPSSIENIIKKIEKQINLQDHHLKTRGLIVQYLLGNEHVKYFFKTLNLKNKL